MLVMRCAMLCACRAVVVPPPPGGLRLPLQRLVRKPLGRGVCSCLYNAACTHGVFFNLKLSSVCDRGLAPQLPVCLLCTLHDMPRCVDAIVMSRSTWANLTFAFMPSTHVSPVSPCQS